MTGSMSPWRRGRAACILGKRRCRLHKSRRGFARRGPQARWKRIFLWAPRATPWNPRARPSATERITFSSGRRLPRHRKLHSARLRGSNVFARFAQACGSRFWPSAESLWKTRGRASRPALRESPQFGYSRTRKTPPASSQRCEICEPLRTPTHDDDLRIEGFVRVMIQRDCVFETHPRSALRHRRRGLAVLVESEPSVSNGGLLREFHLEWPVPGGVPGDGVAVTDKHVFFVHARLITQLHVPMSAGIAGRAHDHFRMLQTTLKTERSAAGQEQE